MKCNMTSCLWNCFIVALITIILYLIGYVILYIYLVQEVNDRYSSDLVAQREKKIASIT